MFLFTYLSCGTETTEVDTCLFSRVHTTISVVDHYA